MYRSKSLQLQRVLEQHDAAKALSHARVYVQQHGFIPICVYAYVEKSSASSLLEQHDAAMTLSLV
jgi:hypothetical protein